MYKKILIPTDGSSLSSAAARAGVAFATQSGAEVIGLYVAEVYQYPIYGEPFPPAFPTEEEHQAAMRSAGERYLGEVRDACAAAGLKFSEIIAFSDRPAEQIVEVAKKNGCDLIFMGSHGRSGWGQLLLGSVTSKVLATCDIPVLVYRSKEPPR